MHFVATSRWLSQSRHSIDYPLHISGMGGYAVPTVAVQVNELDQLQRALQW
jgi:hypothetical protein